MNDTANFTIYNASAGSGKTYNLAKEYIKLLLATDNPLKFKEILAITFTNKAASEMKLRILGYLDAFAKGETVDFFNDLQIELAVDATLMQKRAKNALQGILHNYSAFSVTTIDKFTHKLIKSFAHDMELPVNFEVELDTDKIAQESVDALLSKIGEDKRLDKAIIAYALDKAADDKSWNIALDLHRAAKLLFNENDSKYIKRFKGKSIQDFVVLRKQLAEKRNHYETLVADNVAAYFDLLAEKGIALTEIATTPTTYFKTIKNGEVPRDSFEKAVIEQKSLYRKAQIPETAKLAIDLIRPQLEKLFYESKTNFYQFIKYKNLLKEVTPLTVINEIQKEYEELKDSNNILLIAEFNELISKELKKQAAPYIYERIGEKYHHFFIDEFQDTSTLQWENLIPLIQNAVQSEYAPDQAGTLLLVGDAKQAIYRFRGGKAAQFIDLVQDKNPFFIPKKVANLDTNYRSFDTIINFTNDFFTYIKDVFQNEKHKEIYRIGNQQKTNKQEGGYVEIAFVSGGNVAELDEVYPEEVLKRIHKLTQLGFNYNDIAILTRKKKQGVAIANYLTEKGITIVSSETLLLQNNSKAKLIIALLQLTINSKNQEALIAFLEVFYSFQDKITDRHEFYIQFIRKEESIFEILTHFDIDFDLALFKTFGLFDGLSYIVHQFGFDKKSDAYIQYFLDLIFEFTQRNQSNWMAFLDYWKEKKEKLSISSPEGQNAVQIMTIHKSKGLEFPVVIYPYADNNIYDDLDKHVWLDTQTETDFKGFENLRYSNVNSLQHLDESAQQKWYEYRSALELDAINILYVTLTRPIEQLYILASEKSLTKPKGKAKTTYAEYFRLFLEQNQKFTQQDMVFTMGELHPKKMGVKKINIQTELQEQATIMPWQLLKNSHNETIIKTVTTDSELWNTKQGEAIDLGNLLHKILEQIYVQDDIQIAVSAYVNQGLLAPENNIVPLLNKLVSHPKLAPYFHPNSIVYNERAINVPSGMLHNKHTIIIDRLVFLSDKRVAIIDYKTGEQKPSYTTQLNEYERVLKDMGYTVSEKLLVYMDIETTNVTVVVV